MPSTFPSSASATARSMARPANRPASAALPPRTQCPVLSSGSTPVPCGPTKTSVAASRTCGCAAAFSTISGPIPRASPSVTARTGLSACSVTRWLWSFVRSVQSHGDVRLLAKRVDIAAHATALGQSSTHGGLRLGERHFTGLVDREQLSNDELRNVRTQARAWNLEDRDVVDLFVGERILIAERQAVAHPWRQQARLFATGVVVILLRQRVERRAVLQQHTHAVGERVRACDVRRIHLGHDQDMVGLDLTDLNAVDADDVVARGGRDHRARLTGLQPLHERPAEEIALELRPRLTTTQPAKIAARVLRLNVHRLALRDALEVAAGTNLGEQRLSLHASDFLVRRGGGRRDDDLVPGDRRRLWAEERFRTLELRGDLLVGDVDWNDLAVLLKLPKDALVQVLTAELLHQVLAIVLGRTERRLGQLIPELRFVREVRADLADLAVDVTGDVGVRHFDLQVARFLKQ